MYLLFLSEWHYKNTCGWKISYLITRCWSLTLNVISQHRRNRIGLSVFDDQIIGIDHVVKSPRQRTNSLSGFWSSLSWGGLFTVTLPLWQRFKTSVDNLIKFYIPNSSELFKWFSCSKVIGQPTLMCLKGQSCWVQKPLCYLLMEWWWIWTKKTCLLIGCTDHLILSIKCSTESLVLSFVLYNYKRPSFIPKASNGGDTTCDIGS